MRICILPVTILVLFFQPEEYKCDPVDVNIGPPLRPYSVIPVSHKLKSKITGNVTSAGNVTLQVTLAGETETITSCQWTSPAGIVFDVYKENVIASSNENENIITEQSSNAKVCSLHLRNIQEKYFGTWKCKIVHAASNHFQEVHLSVAPVGKASIHQLPKNLIPKNYSLFMTPFLEKDNFTIQGHVDISLEVTEKGSNKIVLHSEDIQIFENTLKIASSQEQNLVVTGFGYDETNTWFIIYVAENLLKSENYMVSIDYLANLNSDLIGFYRSSYFDKEKNQTEYVATTQFEATGARRAFPCFDEPIYKATFQVNLGRVKDMTSISNMPIEREGVLMLDNNIYVWDMYQVSPIMSTYLLAFVVSNFTFKQTKTDDVQFRVWSRESNSNHTGLALEAGPKILKFFEQHFNIKYPLPKMDLVAMPDYLGGAMENWGLIIFQEKKIIFKHGESGAAEAENILLTIAHELAHQWFGNLVTMEWWNDLWLKEGFATYYAYIGASHYQEQFSGALDKIVFNVVQSALERDSVTSSHPVSVPVNNPSEINQIFDEISYRKGASLIQMMYNFLGEDVFKTGVEKYLNQHKYGNAKQDDLWQKLTEEAHLSGSFDKNVTVKEIMDTWTLKMGYPVVTVNRSNDSNDSSKVRISQQRFLLSSKSSSEENSYRWWVPVSYTTPEKGFEATKNWIWLSPDDVGEKVVKLSEALTADQPLIVNVKQTGFYRVNYDRENWEKITETLKTDHKSIHRTNRAQLVDDCLSLAKAGILDYSIALNLIEYLTKEKDYIPWSSALLALDYIQQMLGRNEGYDDYKDFMIRLLTPIYEDLGFDNKESDSLMDQQLRPKVAKAMCELEHKDCIKETLQRFKSWKSSRTPGEFNLPADLRSLIYCTAIGQGDESTWNYLWDEFRSESTSPSEKNNILIALTCSNQPSTLQTLMDMAINETSPIRKQELRTVLTGVANNKIGRDLAWKWLQKNVHTVSLLFGPSFIDVGRLITTSSSNFNTESQLEEMKVFYANNLADLGAGILAIETSIQKTQANIYWMKENHPVIVDWLKKKNTN